MSDINVWLPFIGAISGGLLVGAINFAMRWQDRKAEEKRHLRELVFKTAMEEWKEHMSFAVETNKTTNKKAFVQPFIAYLVHQTKLSDIFLSGELTKENISSKFCEAESLMEELKKSTGTPQKDDKQNNA